MEMIRCMMWWGLPHIHLHGLHSPHGQCSHSQAQGTGKQGQQEHRQPMITVGADTGSQSQGSVGDQAKKQEIHKDNLQSNRLVHCNNTRTPYNCLTVQRSFLFVG